VSATGTADRRARRPQRRREAALGQDRRVQPARDLAQLLDHAGQAGRRARELLAQLEQVRRRGRLGGPELQPERHEPLLRAVVQVALDAVALGIGGSRDPRPRRRELGAAVSIGDRRRHQLGELGDARLAVGRQRLAVGGAGDHDAPGAILDDDRRPDRRPNASVGREIHAGLAPFPDHGRRAIGLVAQHAGHVGGEDARDLGGDPSEQRLGRRLAGDERGDPAQRGLLVGQTLQLGARLAVGDCGRDELGEAGKSLLGTRGEGPAARVDDHQPPQRAGDDDRAGDRRAHAELADLVGHRPRGAGPVVDACRAPRLTHAARDVDALGHRQARAGNDVVAVGGPRGDDGLGVVGLVARHPGEVGAHEHARLLGDRREDLGRRRAPRDQRGDAPQRRLLLDAHKWRG
jgi:hypothetical protein